MRKPVCVHVSYPSGSPKAVAAVEFIDKMKRDGLFPNEVPTTDDVDQVLSGLLHWYTEWAELPEVEGESRIWLMYDTGFRGEKSSAHTAIVMPSALIAALFLAAKQMKESAGKDS